MQGSRQMTRWGAGLSPCSPPSPSPAPSLGQGTVQDVSQQAAQQRGPEVTNTEQGAHLPPQHSLQRQESTVCPLALFNLSPSQWGCCDG